MEKDSITIERHGLGLKRRFLALQNFVGLLLSVPVLGTGIWLAHKNRTDCATFLQRPIIAIGVLLLVLSLIGLIATAFRTEWLAWLHLILLFCLVILLFCFSIFALEITNEGVGHEVSGQNYTEYRLSDYPRWMRHRVKDQEYWSQVKQCLRRSPTVCRQGVLPAFGSNGIWDIDLTKLDPVQIGCCKPPSVCNVTYVGTLPAGNADAEDLDDCRKWSNLPAVLCYDCDSCKAGEIQASMNHWRNAGLVEVVLVMVMIIMYAFFACYAFET